MPPALLLFRLTCHICLEMGKIEHFPWKLVGLEFVELGSGGGGIKNFALHQQMDFRVSERGKLFALCLRLGSHG